MDAVVGIEYFGGTVVGLVAVVAAAVLVLVADEESENLRPEGVEDPGLAVTVGPVVVNEVEIVDK